MERQLMTTPETHRLIMGLIAKFGVQHQVSKCIEELCELVAELEEFRDYSHDSSRIAEEVADVMFTLNQVVYILGIQKQVTKHFEVIRANCKDLINR